MLEPKSEKYKGETENNTRKNIVFEVSDNWDIDEFWSFFYSVNALYDFSLLVVYGDKIESRELRKAADLLIQKYDLTYKPTFRLYEFGDPLYDFLEEKPGSSFYGIIYKSLVNEDVLEFDNIGPSGISLKVESIEIHSPGEVKLSGLAAVIQQLREIINDIIFRKERRVKSEYATKIMKEELAKAKLKNLEKIIQLTKDLNLSDQEINLITDWAYSNEINLDRAIREDRLVAVGVED